MPLFTPARSQGASESFQLVCDLQKRFADRLTDVARVSFPDFNGFKSATWLRDGGRHGGGGQLVGTDPRIFNRASINVSQVHYDDLPDKPLASANALSTIIHPENPHAPSVHIHISWTGMKNGSGYWRLMADLNPSLSGTRTDRYRDTFASCMRDAAPAQYPDAAVQGDRYFYIPALQRHRGVTHFYLEAYKTANPEADFRLARTFGESIIDCYAAILGDVLRDRPSVSESERRSQLDYHTLYLFQVLTLDRGTTSGLLVHDQNDVGIMGSLPAFVDRDLLARWKPKVPTPQDQLVDGICSALSPVSPSPVNEAEKRALAQVVRAHYRAHPQALELQARGAVIPPTVQNHK